MQTDFILFLRSCVGALKGEMRQWWPETLVYAASRSYGPFEIFARAQSLSYFEKIKGMVGVGSVKELSEMIDALGSGHGARLHIPRWEFDSVNSAELSNLVNLGTKP